MDRRLLRLTIAALLAAVVWVAAQFLGSWLAAVVAFLGLAFVSSLIGERAPALLERIAGDEPLGVEIGADSGFYSDGWSVVLPTDLDTTNTPPEGLEHLQARNHLLEVGAFDLGESHLLLALKGKSVDPIQVTGLRSRVRRRVAPLSGAVVRSPSAGEQRIVAGYVTLDEDESPIRGDDCREYFDDYILTLGRGELFTFRIVGKIEASACEWELVLSYTHRGKPCQLVVDNSGRPFRTAVAMDQVVASYEWAWYEHPPRVVPTPAFHA